MCVCDSPNEFPEPQEGFTFNPDIDEKSVKFKCRVFASLHA